MRGAAAVLVLPGSVPPTESLADVRDTCFFHSIAAGATVHADGNRAWKSEAGRHRVRFTVNHSRMKFTKGHCWSPASEWNSVCAQVFKISRLRHPALQSALICYAHRCNTGQDLWGELGRLCRMHSAALI